MSRIARLVSSSYPHHIIMRGNNKNKIFFRVRDRKIYIKILKQYIKKIKVDLLAYCLMPNHVHLLLVPFQDNALAKVMQVINLSYTQYINKEYMRSGRIWESRFRSSVVDKDEYLWRVIKYIENNPVRAQIVARAEDYRWSSASFHVFNRKDNCLKSIEYIEEKYGIISVKNYDKYLRESYEDKLYSGTITKKTFQNKPIGSEIFEKSISTIITESVA